MISGTRRPRPRRRWLPASLLLAASCASATEDEAAIERLFAALAQPAPTSTPFVEQRDSALLEAPLELRGRLERPAAGSLAREVEMPYRERTLVRGERVTVEREGQRPRSFSLRRSPELAAVLASFQALLDGDRQALEPHYTVTLATAGERWTLQLTPRQPRLQQRLGTIGLHGSGDRLDCIATRGERGGHSRMLVGAAAAELPPAFDAHCDD
jgi:hypothetical protein